MQGQTRKQDLRVDIDSLVRDLVDEGYGKRVQVERRSRRNLNLPSATRPDNDWEPKVDHTDAL